MPCCEKYISWQLGEGIIVVASVTWQLTCDMLKLQQVIKICFSINLYKETATQKTLIIYWRKILKPLAGWSLRTTDWPHCGEWHSDLLFIFVSFFVVVWSIDRYCDGFVVSRMPKCAYLVVEVLSFLHMCDSLTSERMYGVRSCSIFKEFIHHGPMLIELNFLPLR
jgi:hypothetical protein